MGLFIFLAVQLLVTVAGFALLWRRLDGVTRQLDHLRDLVTGQRTSMWAARDEKADQRLAAFIGADFAMPPKPANPPRQRDHGPSHDDEGLPRGVMTPRLVSIEDQGEQPAWLETALNFAPETARTLVVAAALAAPAIGFAFNAPPTAIIAAALCVASAALLVSLREAWRSAAWFATFGGGAWALTGLLARMGAVNSELFAGGLVVAAAAGMAHARLDRPAAPGAVFTLMMAAAALTAGVQFGLVGPFGAGYAAIVAIAAAVGASAMRLESVHLAAFAAAGLGLYALSAQQPADVWFTPAAAWAGVWFLAIAFVRAPQLGLRGVVVAVTGAVAPLFAISALFSAQHGLETPLAAAGAFLLLGAIFATILVLAARRATALANLHLALWALATPAVAAAAIAMLLVAPQPLQPAMLAAFALFLTAIDARWGDHFWRFASVALVSIAAVLAFIVAQPFGPLDARWPPVTVAAFALAMPAALAAACAYLCARRAPITSSILEGFAIFGGAATISAAVRLAFSGGAPALTPLGFVEMGVHAALWLFASLALAVFSRDAREVRLGMAALLTAAGLGMSFACVLAWLTPWLGVEINADLHPPLGFAAPAIAAWAHWWVWRRTELTTRTRVAFGAASLLTAAFITIEAVWLRGGADWITVGLGALGFAIAAGANFTPGVAVRGRKPAAAAPALEQAQPKPPQHA